MERLVYEVCFIKLLALVLYAIPRLPRHFRVPLRQEHAR